MITKKVGATLFAAGYCTHAEKWTIKGGTSQICKFPAIFACIEHPELGPILFDSGYSERFFTETSEFPYSLYRRTTPVFYTEAESAANQLRQRGVDPADVKYVILSHFHADHIAGLGDFPHASFIYLSAAYEAVRHRRGFAAVRAGFLPGLLPPDFAARSLPIDERQTVPLPVGFPFPRGLDVFGDGSIIAVDIPGHAAGQIGLLLATDERTYFLCADAVWSSKAYRELLPPHPLAGLIMSSRKLYMQSFRSVHELHKRYPDIRIVPTHCVEVWESLAMGGVRL